MPRTHGDWVDPTIVDTDYTTLDSLYINEGQSAGGDLSGTYPNPSVIDDSHNHTTTTLPATIVYDGDTAGGDLSGTYPSPSVVDDSHNHSSSSVLTVDTRANILALTPTSGRIALATDSLKFYIADGTYWYETQLSLNLRPEAPEMGYGIDTGQGYTDTEITNKKIYNSAIKGHPATPIEGSIKTDADNDPITFEIYLRGQWNTIIYDLTTTYGDFRHTPLDEQIYVWRGDSVSLGLNGRPIITEYEACMGAYPPARLLSGVKGVF